MPLSPLSGDVAAHFFRELAPHYDVRPGLPEIAVPTLVVVGTHDWVCPPVAARLLADGIPRARLARIAGAGHFPFSEEPEAFQEAVTSFLDDPHGR